MAQRRSRAGRVTGELAGLSNMSDEELRWLLTWVAAAGAFFLALRIVKDLTDLGSDVVPHRHHNASGRLAAARGPGGGGIGL